MLPVCVYYIIKLGNRSDRRRVFFCFVFYFSFFLYSFFTGRPPVKKPIPAFMDNEALKIVVDHVRRGTTNDNIIQHLVDMDKINNNKELPAWMEGIESIRANEEAEESDIDTDGLLDPNQTGTTNILTPGKQVYYFFYCCL